MANNDDKKDKIAYNKARKLLSGIDTQMDDVFQSTYSSRNTNRKELDNISDELYDRVNSILSTNTDVQGVPNISRLYNRLKGNNGKTSGDIEQINGGVQEIFNDPQLLNMVATNPDINRYIKSLDEQYDMICKYMPKLKDALDIKKDNVLSADNFTKSFINASNETSSTGERKELFDSRIKDIKERYKFEEKVDKWYDNASLYGEEFIWIVPYKKALDELIAKNSGIIPHNIRLESTNLIHEGKVDKEFFQIPENFKGNFGDVKISFDNSGMLSEAVMEAVKAQKILTNSKKSLYESFSEATSNGTVKLDKTIGSELQFDSYEVANDGLISGKKLDKDTLKDIPGCIVRTLVHHNVKPIYIDNICLGYYYLEFSSRKKEAEKNNIVSTSTMPGNSGTMDDIVNDNELMTRYLADKISNAIDKRFINANHDLKDEIYIMLKYNDQFNINANNYNDIKVTFLPPEDVVHFYFDLDEDTKHGVSDLKRALVPAMFHCLLDLSTTVGLVTRAQDKRIYYVKQNIETNVARTLLNVVNQVKKGNMGIRQMESMNNILNIVGRYNDHIVPLGPSGDAPIQFEVMQGQQIDTPEILLNKWEETAINSTDVPLELINATLSMDYAIKYTMSNSRFLRKVFKRQFIAERRLSGILTRIYNYEYGESEQVTVSLPAPTFLSMSNGGQLLQNTKDYVQQIADLEYTEDGPEKKEFIKMMMRHLLATHMNTELIDKFKNQAQLNIATTKVPNKEDEV